MKNGQKIKEVFKQTTRKLLTHLCKIRLSWLTSLLRLRECGSSKILNLCHSQKSQKRLLQTCWNPALKRLRLTKILTHKLQLHSHEKKKTVDILNASFGYLQNQRFVEEKSTLLREEKNSRQVIIKHKKQGWLSIKTIATDFPQRQTWKMYAKLFKTHRPCGSSFRLVIQRYK